MYQASETRIPGGDLGTLAGQIRQLPPLKGDTVGLAIWINDKSQAVGASATCANMVLPPLAAGTHAVLWDNGLPIDLGNLGGTVNTDLPGVGNVGLYVNNQSQVVGVSALPGSASAHAFLWTEETGMQDLGTLPGDVNSSGLGINDRGEVVGGSVDADGNLRAFVRQNGVMSDLATLIPANSPVVPIFASIINSRGEIVGYGVTGDGDIHGFLATPTSGLDTGGANPMILTGDVRKDLQQRPRSSRFGGRFMRSR